MLTWDVSNSPQTPEAFNLGTIRVVHTEVSKKHRDPHVSPVNTANMIEKPRPWEVWLPFRSAASAV